MYRQIFGNENAATDDLLEDCYVAPPGVVLEKPILIGKWGTGKTGLLLNRNAPLSRVLRAADFEKARIWYLDETGVQLQTLKHIERECAGDLHLTKRVLEDLWRSEIIRACASILFELHDHYGNPAGAHWDSFLKIFERTSKRSVWDLIPSALGTVIAKDKADSANEVFARIRSIHDDATLKILNRCLNDIKHFDVQPVVAIEPIETPTSEVEEKTDLAQLLVTCLLNVFYKYFQPSTTQLVRVEISIPWHRYVRDQVGEPQKLYPFIGRFKWSKSSLRNFINKRIEWEFRRIKRNFNTKGPIDAWGTIFPDTVKNSNTGDQEKSFDYIIRHTQYRVRDLLRLTRECVEHEAVNREISVDEVLHGRSGTRISERNIRAAVVKACKATATDRVLEGNRRFPGLAEHVELLRGIAVPFKISEVTKRINRRYDNNRPELVLMLNDMWNSGIIGLQIKAKSTDSVKQLKASLDSGTAAFIDNEQKNATFYVFDYASDKNIMDIVNTFDSDDGNLEHGDINVSIVLHPMLFEHLDARINEKHPIGI